VNGGTTFEEELTRESRGEKKWKGTSDGDDVTVEADKQYL
jgi:hypothetical protein